MQSNLGSFLFHEPTKTFIGKVLYWSSCSWIRVVFDGPAGVSKIRAKKAIQAVMSGDSVVQVLSGLLGTTAVGPNIQITAQQVR